jgi:tRNA pseudouridine55 synthase
MWNRFSERGGLLCVRKPAGVTSRDVVNMLQKLVRPLKAGHAGTLDPLATGVLVIAIGAATRLVRYVQNQPKHYRGEFELGLTTDTDDITGRVLARQDAGSVSITSVRNVLTVFRGTIAQIPPRFSAVHVQGQRAYDLARRGEQVELTSRPVEVHALELVEFAPPRLVLDVACGSGTYIRALGRDIGQRLGCGAAMSALERRAVGVFTLDRAVPPEHLTRDTLNDCLWPLTSAVEGLPRWKAAHDQQQALGRGQSVCVAGETLAISSGEVAVLDDRGELVAIAELNSGRLQPRLVLPAPALCGDRPEVSG